MAKLLSSPPINYGATLPAPSATTAGMLFYKTQADLTGTNPAGLYLAGFQLDSNAATPGDQVGFGWTPVAFSGTYLGTDGGTLTGQLNLDPSTGLKLTSNTDYASIYLRANAYDSTDLVFELGDNGANSGTNPDSFVFRGVGTPGV